MKSFRRITTLSRQVLGFGCGWVALLVLTSCERTFITNNYLASPPQDANVSGQQDAQAVVTDAGASQSDGGVITFDAALREDAGNEGPSGSSDASSVDAGGTTGDAGAKGPRPLAEGVPLVNTGIEDQTVDVFGTFNNHYWFVATEAQVEALNDKFQNGGGGGGWWGGFYGGSGDIYQPNTGKDALNAVEHLVITTPDGKTADYGLMKVKLVGQSTGRPWTETTLPNFKLDTDDVTAGLRIGGYEHVRLNNAVIGTIFREKFVYDFYNALGYPAPRSSYAWVSSTVWGPEVKVPYIVTESYKRGFCKKRPEEFGEGCPNMWEFADDFGWGVFSYDGNCQFDQCDATRATQFENAVLDVHGGGSTTVADLEEYIDWEKFHEFQCLAWMFGTTDSPPLASNNTVWAERADGKFQMLPYSIDISLSLGSSQWFDPGLYGYTHVAEVCQRDEQCWADTIAVCEGMITKFVELDPVGRIDQLYTDLQTAGMLRSGDEGRYQDLRAVLDNMVTQLPTALDLYRDVRDPNDQCGYYGMVNCGGYCEYPEFCYLCDDAYYEDPGYTGGPIGATGGGPIDNGATGGTVPLPVVLVPTATATVPVPTTGTAPPPDGGVGSQKPDFCYDVYDYAQAQAEAKSKPAYVSP